MGGQKVTKISSNIDATSDIAISRLRERPTAKSILELVARRGVREEVNFPPGGRRFGRKEEKKKGRKKERNN